MLQAVGLGWCVLFSDGVLARGAQSQALAEHALALLPPPDPLPPPLSLQAPSTRSGGCCRRSWRTQSTPSTWRKRHPLSPKVPRHPQHPREPPAARAGRGPPPTQPSPQSRRHPSGGQAGQASAGRSPAARQLGWGGWRWGLRWRRPSGLAGRSTAGRADGDQAAAAHGA